MENTKNKILESFIALLKDAKIFSYHINDTSNLIKISMMDMENDNTVIGVLKISQSDLKIDLLLVSKKYPEETWKKIEKLNELLAPFPRIKNNTPLFKR